MRGPARPAPPPPGLLTTSNLSLVFLRKGAASECRRAGFAGADAGNGQEVEHEDLAVTDAAGLGALADGGDDRVGLCVVDGDLDLELGQEVHRVFGAAIDFRVSLLTAVAFDLGHGHAVHVERVERLTHLFKPRRLDDCDHQFHGCPFPLALVSNAPRDSSAVPDSQAAPQSYDSVK